MYTKYDISQPIVVKLVISNINAPHSRRSMWASQVVLSPDWPKSAIRLKKSVSFFLGY